MRKKRNDFDAVGVEQMTDAELSKKLGGYQRTESIGMLLGVLLVIAGCISMFIQHRCAIGRYLSFSRYFNERQVIFRSIA